MLTEQKIGALEDIIAAACQKGQGHPHTKHITAAIFNAKYYQNLETSIELVAKVAEKAGGLEDGAADAFDWIATAAAQIAQELRSG